MYILHSRAPDRFYYFLVIVVDSSPEGSTITKQNISETIWNSESTSHCFFRAFWAFFLEYFASTKYKLLDTTRFYRLGSYIFSS